MSQSRNSTYPIDLSVDSSSELIAALNDDKTPVAAAFRKTKEGFFLSKQGDSFAGNYTIPGIKKEHLKVLVPVNATSLLQHLRRQTLSALCQQLFQPFRQHGRTVYNASTIRITEDENQADAVPNYSLEITSAIKVLTPHPPEMMLDLGNITWRFSYVPGKGFKLKKLAIESPLSAISANQMKEFILNQQRVETRADGMQETKLSKLVSGHKALTIDDFELSPNPVLQEIVDDNGAWQDPKETQRGEGQFYSDMTRGTGMEGQIFNFSNEYINKNLTPRYSADKKDEKLLPFHDFLRRTYEEYAIFNNKPSITDDEFKKKLDLIEKHYVQSVLSISILTLYTSVNFVLGEEDRYWIGFFFAPANFFFDKNGNLNFEQLIDGLELLEKDSHQFLLHIPGQLYTRMVLTDDGFVVSGVIPTNPLLSQLYLSTLPLQIAEPLKGLDDPADRQAVAIQLLDDEIQKLHTDDIYVRDKFPAIYPDQLAYHRDTLHLKELKQQKKLELPLPEESDVGMRVAVTIGLSLLVTGALVGFGIATFGAVPLAAWILTMFAAVGIPAAITALFSTTLLIAIAATASFLAETLVFGLSQALYVFGKDAIRQITAANVSKEMELSPKKITQSSDASVLKTIGVDKRSDSSPDLSSSAELTSSGSIEERPALGKEVGVEAEEEVEVEKKTFVV